MNIHVITIVAFDHGDCTTLWQVVGRTGPQAVERLNNELATFEREHEMPNKSLARLEWSDNSALFESDLKGFANSIDFGLQHVSATYNKHALYLPISGS